MEKCDERLVKRLDELTTRIRDLEISVVKIETSLSHTLQNKHAEAVATAQAIDIKFRWISVLVGGVATVAIFLQIADYFQP